MIRLNVAGILPSSETSSAAPVTDRSRIVQGVLMPPYSILAGFMTRWRGAIRVSTMLIKLKKMEQHAPGKMSERSRSSEQRYRLDVLKNPAKIREGAG